MGWKFDFKPFLNSFVSKISPLPKSTCQPIIVDWKIINKPNGNYPGVVLTTAKKVNQIWVFQVCIALVGQYYVRALI